jgi:hypothetical protein
MRSHKQPEPSSRPLVAIAAATIAVAAGAGCLLQRAWKSSDDKGASAARNLGAGAAILCASVAADSGLEHYRGGFKNPIMFIGPAMALIGLGAACSVAIRPRSASSSATRTMFVAVGASGLVGLGFHAFNIVKRPGQLSVLNLFYGAPAGAPVALALASLYGVIAGRLSGASTAARARIVERAAMLVALSLAGTSAEAGLLHFRGAFQNPAMYGPVAVPPLAALSIGAAPFSSQAMLVASPLLKASAVLGIAGPFFHAYGIHRNMGGWRNWSQMLLQGPPLPAPPAFLGIAAAGIGLLPSLQERWS